VWVFLFFLVVGFFVFLAGGWLGCVFFCFFFWFGVGGGLGVFLVFFLRALFYPFLSTWLLVWEVEFSGISFAANDFFSAQR